MDFSFQNSLSINLYQVCNRIGSQIRHGQGCLTFYQILKEFSNFFFRYTKIERENVKLGRGETRPVL